VLDDWPVDQRHHLLGDRLRSRQEASAKPCGRKDGLTDTHDEWRSPWVLGPALRPPGASSGARVSLGGSLHGTTEYSNCPGRSRPSRLVRGCAARARHRRVDRRRSCRRYNRRPMLKSFVRTLRGPSRDPRMAHISRPLPRNLLDEQVLQALDIALAENPDPAYLVETLRPALH